MPTPNSDTSISPFAGFGIAVLAVSMSAILVRWSVTPSLVKAFYRVLFTVALLAPVALVHHRDALAAILGRGLLAVEGMSVAFTIHFASRFENLNHTTITVSVALVQFQPFFVIVDVWAVLDEHVSRCTVVGVGVAFTSTALISVSDFLTVGSASWPLLGSGLAAVRAVTTAVYVLTGRNIHNGVSLVSYVVVVYSVCVATLLVVMAGRGGPLTGYPPRERPLFLGMAVGPGVFDHTVISWALVYLEPSVVSVSLLGKPVGSTILALFLLGEIPTPPTVFGGAVTLGGICISAS